MCSVVCPRGSGAVGSAICNCFETFTTTSNLQKRLWALYQTPTLCPRPSTPSLRTRYAHTVASFWTHFSSIGTTTSDARQHGVSLRHSSQCNFVSKVEDEKSIFLSLFQVRSNIRHYFLEPPQLKLLYDVTTWIVTQIAISYTVVPFVLLSIKPSFMFYR